MLDREKDNIKIPIKRKLAYGVGGLIEPFSMEIIGGFLLLFYNTLLGVDAVLVGWALTIPRFWDAVTDPIMGHFSDNFRSRWGRRRPFIMIAGPISCFLFFLFWTVPQEFTQNSKFIYLTIIGIFYYSFSTVALVPYGALGVELSTDYHERTRIFSIQALFRRSGSLICVPLWWLIFGSGLFLVPRHGFVLIALVLAVLAALSYLTVALGTREKTEWQFCAKSSVMPVLRRSAANGPFVLLIVTMFIMVLGLMCSFPFVNYINIYHVFRGNQAAAGKVMAIGGYLLYLCILAWIPVFNWIGVRIGKRNALFLSLASLTGACLSSWWSFDPGHPWLQLVFIILVAPANAGITIFPSAMLADIIDLDELHSGERCEGFYSAVLAFIIKLAASVSTLWMGYCLRWVGFDQTASVQTPETLFNLRLALVVFPIIASVISAGLLVRYTLDAKRVGDIREVLEARRLPQVSQESFVPVRAEE